MMQCEEKAKRLEEALAKSIAETYKGELLAIVNAEGPLTHKYLEQVRYFREGIRSMYDLADFIDVNMIPPQSEWLSGKPLVVEVEDANQFQEDLDGRQLSADVFNRMMNIVDQWIRDGRLRERMVQFNGTQVWERAERQSDAGIGPLVDTQSGG